MEKFLGIFVTGIVTIKSSIPKKRDCQHFPVGSGILSK